MLNIRLVPPRSIQSLYLATCYDEPVSRAVVNNCMFAHEDANSRTSSAHVAQPDSMVAETNPFPTGTSEQSRRGFAFWMVFVGNLVVDLLSALDLVRLWALSPPWRSGTKISTDTLTDGCIHRSSNNR